MPGWFVDLGRYVGGLLVFTLCATFSGAALIPCVYLFRALDGSVGTVWAVAAVPFLWGVWGLGLCLCIIVYKRVIFYRPKAGEWPLFSVPVVGWGTTGALSSFANEMFLKHWKGTPYINWWLRGMGAHIGRRVNINTVQVFDWDLITIDDDAILGGDCVVQAHILEAGKMRMAPVHIGKRALIGTRATVMPGCTVEDSGVLGASSMMKKGDTVRQNTIYAGTPAHFIRERGAKDKDDSGVAPDKP